MTQSGSLPDGAPREDGEQPWQTQPRQPVPPARPVAPPQPSWTSGLTSTTPIAGPAGLFLADVPNRIIACIIDIIVLAIIGFLIALVVGGLLGGLVGNLGELNLLAFLVAGLLHLTVSAAYFVYLWSTLRVTVGTRLLGLQLGDERDGRSIPLRQGLVRWLLLGIPATLTTFPVYVASPFAWVLFLIGSVWLVVLLISIAVSPTKQGYHDRHAHTVVVKATRRAA